MKRFFRQIASVLLIALGMIAAGLGVKGFLLPAGFIDGGVTGISMLVSALSGVALPVFILIFNAQIRSTLSIRY